jgi:putative endonuclease
VNNAITRETEMKKWRREKKIALIVKENPTWEDLAKDWGTPMAGAQQIPHLLKQVRNDKGLE